MDTTMGAGARARRPTKIPAKGWKEILKRTGKETKADHVSLLSAGMTFYALLSLIPLLTAFVLIYSLIFDPTEVNEHLSQISHLMPAQYERALEGQISKIAAESSTALGWGLFATLGFSLWSGSKASKALIEALNIIYEEEDNRGFVKKAFLALGFTFVGILCSILSLAIIVGLPAVLGNMGLGQAAQIGTTTASWIILIGLISFFLAFSYRFAPHRNSAKWRWVSVGSVFAAVIWLAASGLFSWYVSNFNSYDKTYGSLGGVIALMMWFYITSFIILFGGQINAEQERQTKVDSTKGRPRPRGSRGAKMADA